eukprot:UN22266
MVLPWYYHGNTVLPRYCHGITTVLPLCYSGITKVNYQCNTEDSNIV